MAATMISLPSVILTNADQQHRQNFKDYCIHQADPSFRATLVLLYQNWETWNQTYFGNQMTVPYILLGTPRYPMALGSTQSISDFGGKMQITLRHSVVNGTHPHLINGSQNMTGLDRFLLDVFLHEVVHQYCFEVLGKPEEAEKGHGPVFADECTRIGALLGLPPVGPARSSKRAAGVPSCAQWPLNVRPQGYYLGAYDPQAAPTSGSRTKSGASNPNDQALIQMLQAEVTRLNQKLSLVTAELQSTRSERDQAKREISRYQQSAAVALHNEANARRERDQAITERDQALALAQVPDIYPGAQQALCDLLTQQGWDITRDQRRFTAALKDVVLASLPQDWQFESRRRAALLSANVLALVALVHKSRTPVTQLSEEYGIAASLAEWAVATWQDAINAVSSVRVTA